MEDKTINKELRHVAIIMDGNGRWAQKRGLLRVAGHRVGIESVRSIVSVCEDLGVDILTLYAFSSENWSRPRLEVRGLMALLIEFLDVEMKNMMDNGVRLSAIGDLDGLPRRVQSKLHLVVERTKRNNRVRVNLAINYGGRQEILRAINAILEESCKGNLDVCDVNEDLIKRYLYTHDLPNPQLLIRTGGEKRISNFLLWQLSDTQMYDTLTLWPDFREEDFRSVLQEMYPFVLKKTCLGGQA